MRYTKTTQSKLQEILKSQGYSIRYEKGNFKGGYCVVMTQKVVIINKFFPLESKINTLAEVIRDIELDPSMLSPNQLSLIKQIQQTQ